MTSSTACPRLCQIAAHIPADNQTLPALDSLPQTSPKLTEMSSQEDHPTVLIPGPVEFDDAVLQAMAHPSESHVGEPFVDIFGKTLQLLRKLFITHNNDSQPLVLSGSGTLGWDVVASNLAEPGDEVLVLHSGYFADSFAECFKTYGVNATQLMAPIGSCPSLLEVEEELKSKEYKIITITHTDTSTGVLSDVQAVSKLVQRVSPNTLVVVDGVCSVGCEELRFDDWGLDVVLTASQKAIGAPAGLCIMMFSGKAIKTFEARKAPPGSYFASLKNWLPIMNNYEDGKPSYFATPSSQLIRALHTSLKQILRLPLSSRFEDHKAISKKVKKTVEALGLRQLASSPANQANGMTAMYLPEGVIARDLLKRILDKGFIMAGGLHREIAGSYIRFGHMGVSVTDMGWYIDKALEALKEALEEVRYKKV